MQGVQRVGIDLKLNACCQQFDTQQVIDAAKPVIAINEKPNQAALLQVPVAKGNLQIPALEFERNQSQMNHGRIFATTFPMVPKHSVSNTAVSIQDFGFKAAWIEAVKAFCDFNCALSWQIVRGKDGKELAE